MLFILLALLLALIGCGFQFRDWWVADNERRREAKAACEAAGHPNASYSSVYDEGRSWQLKCPDCGYYTPLEIEEVPDSELKKLAERRRKKSLLNM
jgi:hypothetical protein